MQCLCWTSPVQRVLNNWFGETSPYLRVLLVLYYYKLRKGYTHTKDPNSTTSGIVYCHMTIYSYPVCQHPPQKRAMKEKVCTAASTKAQTTTTTQRKINYQQPNPLPRTLLLFSPFSPNALFTKIVTWSHEYSVVRDE